MFKDESLPAMGATKEQLSQFQIAWLTRRVENLEDIICELLRDRVNHELLEGYMKSLSNPGFGPNSSYIKDRGKQIANMMDRGTKENMGWPPKK